MNFFKPKIFISIILILFIITLIVVGFLFINNSKKETIESVSQNENYESITENTKTPIIVGIEEEEKIYGYDENAMQVQEYYDGFPACGFIEIYKTGLSLPILSNQTVAGMEYSCCKLYSTGEFNLSGNTYIVGHNYNNNTLFSNNQYLQVGDTIVITGLYKNRIEYTIYNMFNTTPDDVSYLTKEVNENDIEITLQTCNNDAEDTRLIIEAVHHIKK